MTHDKSPLLSILIPVRNGENKVDKLLSCIAKKNDKVEIIFVNDMSSDGTFTKLANVLGNVCNVTIVSGVFNGPGLARDLAIKNAKSDWVWLVDSDDNIKIDPVLQELKNTSTDDYDCLSFFASEMSDRQPTDDTRVFTSAYTADIHDSVIDCYKKFGRIGAKIFSRSWLLKNNVFYELAGVGSDHVFKVNVVAARPRIKKFSDIIYYIEQTPNSITTADFDWRRLHRIFVLSRVCDRFKSVGADRDQSFLDFYISSFESYVLRFLADLKRKRRFFDFLILAPCLCQIYFDIGKSHKISVFHQIFALMKGGLNSRVILAISMVVYGAVLPRRAVEKIFKNAFLLRSDEGLFSFLVGYFVRRLNDKFDNLQKKHRTQEKMRDYNRRYFDVILDRPTSPKTKELRDRGWILGKFSDPQLLRQFENWCINYGKYRVLGTPSEFFLSYAEAKSYATIAHVVNLAESPYLHEIVLNLGLEVETASEYVGGGEVDAIRAWWSFPPVFGRGTQMGEAFHRDNDARKFIKIFLYITPVDELSGPHIYVEGSHRMKGCLKARARFTDSEVSKTFGSDVVKRFVGDAGTIIVEDTFGVHKGESPVMADRLMLQLLVTAEKSVFANDVPQQISAFKYELNRKIA